MDEKYRYIQSAGALNEAAPVMSKRAAPPPARASAAHAAALAGLAQQSDEERGEAGAPRSLASMPRQERARVIAAGRGGRGGVDPHTQGWRWGLFYVTVEDGQRVLLVDREGRMEEVVGPRRVWSFGKRVQPMAHHVAHPGEFLIARFRDGRQEHLRGPAHVWFDPRAHLSIGREDALQIATREAVVVYARDGAGEVRRRVVEGPAVFVPEPGEWLHTFSWHGARGGDDGYRKVPNGLVFQKLWLLPDQMYHDVTDVRTADDALLTIRLMVFFELVDIERMLASTHDPIGDFVNAATSDVVDFLGRHDFASFKRHTEKLNELAAYPQLAARAQQCGYRIDKVVYRGYGAPDSLQEMHDKAIESRTRLALERATMQQAQELEDFTLERTLARSERQRDDRAAESDHEIALSKRRREADLDAERARQTFLREQQGLDARQSLEVSRARDAERRAHLDALRALGVDLTALLTQGRADQVIELRGGAEAAHLHLSARE
ncbi:MAG: hypothetical protein R3A48_21535 [Polyangiales bacterium]